MENIEFREAEQKHKISVRLEFFRHDEKESGIPPGGGDGQVPLTAKGRAHATEKGKEKNPNSEMAVAFDSGRVRAKETAMRHMLANEDKITNDSTLEDIKSIVAEKVKVGNKDLSDPRLNFNWQGTAEFKEAAYGRYNNSKDALRFLVEDSDGLAEKLHDKISTSWSRQAGNLAEIVKKYLDVLPNWQRIVEQNPEKYAKAQNEMQRFLGSHQTINESFLMKVIDKVDGRRAVIDFIASLPNKNGFDYSEGYTVNLQADETGNHITMKYKNKQWELTPELIDEIIKDKLDLDK